MRRRRIPKPKAKQVVEEVEPIDPRLEKSYHQYNPMRDNDEPYWLNGELGAMPHEYEPVEFVEYLILNGMSESGYWENVEAGEAQAADIDKNGIPIQTDKLTFDQKGWAKADHFDHFMKGEVARWRPIPSKDSKVKPFKPAPRIHDRTFREACDDGSEAKLELWGYRWDMRELWQCQKCGEVIVKTLAIKVTTNGDDNDDS